MKIRYFTIGLVLIIFFVTYSQENAYSSPEKKSQEYSISLTYQEYPSESCSCVAFRLDDFSDHWLDGKISNKEFVHGIDYLIKNRIIKI